MTDLPVRVAIVGPTASGKTAVAVSLAEMVGGEVVSADSMQIWRGMDIGTAKPTAGERARVRFHLLDVADPRSDFSVAQFQQMSAAAIADIEARGKRAILAGGTGLYVRAVTEGLGFPPRGDSGARERLRTEAARVGSPALLERLRQVDPDAAGRLAPADTKRIVRALDVYEATGRTITSFQEEDRRRRQKTTWKLFGLEYSRSALAVRIDERASLMLSRGLVDEVRGLVESGLSRDSQAGRALGYAEILAYLDGECTLDEAVAAIKLHTRRYAKRQRTWFRADERIEWLDAEHTSADALGDEIARRIGCAGTA